MCVRVCVCVSCRVRILSLSYFTSCVFLCLSVCVLGRNARDEASSIHSPLVYLESLGRILAHALAVQVQDSQPCLRCGVALLRALLKVRPRRVIFLSRELQADEYLGEWE